MQLTSALYERTSQQVTVLLSWSTWRSELLNVSSMASHSDNARVESPNHRVYISLPNQYFTAFAEKYDLDHGLVVRDLNPFVNEGYVRAYFREFGLVTLCKVKRSPISGENKAVAYVRFSTEDEADRAEWAGPHFIGSTVEVRRVVSPKTEDDSDEDVAVAPALHQTRRSIRLGYILEDAQGLDNDQDDEFTNTV